MIVIEYKMQSGGSDPEIPVDYSVKAMANEMKPLVETALGKTFYVYIPICYKSQVVNGVNFSIKVKVDCDKYLHMKIFKPSSCNGTKFELLSQSDDHSVNDPL